MQILSGRNPVNIFGEPQPVRAKIASFDTFSGHADRHELRRYVEALNGRLKKIFIVHGEESQSLAFAETLKTLKPDAEVFAPRQAEVATV